MKKLSKAFTLIELLAVIIILTILSLIATPVIINVINSAKDKSDLESVHGILDSARLYYSESMMDNDKKNDIENLNNIYEKVSLSVKEKTGELYINEKGLSAIAVVIRNKCYTKKFSGNIQISEDTTNCTLGYVGIDTTAPTVSFNVADGTFNTNGWAKNNFNVNITISDNESGPSSYKYCIDTKDCEPIALVNNSTGFSEINTESETNKVCVIGIDNYGNESSIICSDNYKLDKTNPTIAVNNISINKNTTIDLNSDVTTNDNLSGVDNYTYDPANIDTSVAGTKTVTYTVIDKSGNSASIDRIITVITDKPSIAYNTLTSPNGNGWFNSNFYIKAIATPDSTTSINNILWCSSTSDCTPTTTLESDNVTAYITSNSATNKMCVQAIDRTGNTSDIICSSDYKLDAIAPTAGTATFTGTIGSNGWYISNVTVNVINGSDTLSGHNSTISDVSNITYDTNGQTITLTTTDMAGNTSTRNYSIKVDRSIPVLTAKTEAIEVIKGTNVAVSNYFNNPVYGISGGTLSCNPVNTSNLLAGSQVVSCTAVGNNGLSVTTNKTINVKVMTNSIIYYSLANNQIIYIDQNNYINEMYYNSYGNWVVAEVIDEVRASSVILKEGYNSNTHPVYIYIDENGYINELYNSNGRWISSKISDNKASSVIMKKGYTSNMSPVYVYIDENGYINELYNTNGRWISSRISDNKASSVILKGNEGSNGQPIYIYIDDNGYINELYNTNGRWISSRISDNKASSVILKSYNDSNGEPQYIYSNGQPRYIYIDQNGYINEMYNSNGSWYSFRMGDGKASSIVVKGDENSNGNPVYLYKGENGSINKLYNYRDSWLSTIIK